MICNYYCDSSSEARVDRGWEGTCRNDFHPMFHRRDLNDKEPLDLYAHPQTCLKKLSTFLDYRWILREKNKANLHVPARTYSVVNGLGKQANENSNTERGTRSRCSALEDARPLEYYYLKGPEITPRYTTEKMCLHFRYHSNSLSSSYESPDKHLVWWRNPFLHDWK